MRSIITKATMGVAATAVALAVAAAPALASSPSPTAAAGDSIIAQSVGHWQYEGTYRSYHTCMWVQNYYESIDVTAQCR